MSFPSVNAFNGKKAGIVSLMILAFLLYFLSEAMLRQAAVSNINPQSVNVESLVSKLPASVRSSVNYKIEIKRLRNAVRDAANDTEKVSALIALADYTQEPGQRLWLYSEILKEYPRNPETARVYTAFLYNEADGPQFKPADLQLFILPFEQMAAYNMWVAGLNRMIALKLPNAEVVKFLSPLLSLKPEFREYGRLYAEIAKIAIKDKDKELQKKAEDLVEYTRGLQTFDDALRLKAEALQAEKASKASGKKSGKGI